MESAVTGVVLPKMRARSRSRWVPRRLWYISKRLVSSSFAAEGFVLDEDFDADVEDLATVDEDDCNEAILSSSIWVGVPSDLVDFVELVLDEESLESLLKMSLCLVEDILSSSLFERDDERDDDDEQDFLFCLDTT